MHEHIKKYLKSVENDLSAGISTEHTFRPALKELIESIASGITATNEPKRVACGAPDLIITKGHVPVGYIEAKDVGKSLDEAERSEQLARYLEGLGNLILTDYLEFRWYADGKPRLVAKLAKAGARGKLQIDKEGFEKFAELIDAFLNNQIPTIGTPKDLAVRMAALAHIIRDTIEKAFDSEEGGGTLHRQMEGFRKILLHDLTKEKFADMYAQTICYGLFAARCNIKSGAKFTREHAAYDLPKTNPFLRKMFAHIAGPDLDERITWAVDDLAELLARADIEAILKDFGKRTRQEDPVVHFYETFLAAYDPKLKKARGVYYTPEPVVSYIVRSVDSILKTDFKIKDGLADTSKVRVQNPETKKKTESHKVLILDPATGTGTFLHGVIDHIHESFKGNKGMWSGYVSQHLLPRIFGFELLTAPYAVAHMKLGLQLAETGYDFKTDERLRVYLTNTLEEAHTMTGLPIFTQWLAEEANAAAQVKKDAPVMVVLGNPPYSVTSLNKSFVKNIQANYYPKDEIKEANPGALLDDYVKFIRFGQVRIEQTGYGILAFITNHGYLDNPTFRRMRHSLMETFDDIYILDLHGNSKKKEKCPDGSKDENVFDIQQGVTIGLYVKKQKKTGSKREPRISHSDLWGLRNLKYKWLWENNLSTTEWKIIKPQTPFHLFVKQDTRFFSEYEKGWPLTRIMLVAGNGIITRKDQLLIDFSKEVLIEKFEDIASLSPSAATDKYNIRSSSGWNFSDIKNQISKDEVKGFVNKILYRPFDYRFIYYNKVMIERGDHRFPLMRHMLQVNNLALATTRQVTSLNFCHILCTRKLMEKKTCSHDRSTTLLPLYLYPETDIEKAAGAGRRPNLAPEFIRDFSGRLGMEFVLDGKGDRVKTFGPEDIFDYMYAMFHSPAYRSRYAEFLKIDFPRLPLTSKTTLFRKLCELGAELVSLHLMEKHISIITNYPVAGDNEVEKVNYTEPGAGSKKGRVWINKIQYFEGVPPEVWNFQVGGYQVCHKWLKDRKGRKLTYDDLTHYQNIVVVLAETIGIMGKIDTAIGKHGGWPIN